MVFWITIGNVQPVEMTESSNSSECLLDKIKSIISLRYKNHLKVEYLNCIFEKLIDWVYLDSDEKKDIMEFLADEQVKEQLEQITWVEKILERIQKWTIEVSQDWLVWNLDVRSTLIDLLSRVYVKTDIWVLMKTCIESGEKDVLIENSNLSIDSNWWEKTLLEDWTKIKVNQYWDVFEFIEWEYAWMQVFQLSAAVRYADEQWKIILTKSIWEDILKKFGEKYYELQDVLNLITYPPSMGAWWRILNTNSALLWLSYPSFWCGNDITDTDWLCFSMRPIWPEFTRNMSCYAHPVRCLQVM